jgi:SAM-dependent methyltransferase
VSKKPTIDADGFIARWSETGGGERSNYQMFLTELCELIGAPKPDPAKEDESRNHYVFERRVAALSLEGTSTSNYIDLYKRGCFVLEAKQSAKRQKQLKELSQLSMDLPAQRVGSGKRGGAHWDTVMRNAREQAEGYARRLPVEDGWPPFLVIVDVGHVIELFADFSLQGKYYAQFPDRQSFRIALEDLRKPEIRERLRLLWTDPLALNPARHTADVTRIIAELLAKLSKSMETRLIRALPARQQAEKRTADEHAIAEKVAMFLMRCLFTMFAEDIGLLKQESFSKFLSRYKGRANRLHFALEQLWKDMDAGRYSPVLEEDVLRFNGGLFRDATALEINDEELDWLTIAANRKWRDVEPAIFGTLLERALSPAERHRLGAHYTPRVYVERLVVATIIEPLTEDWRNVQAAAAQLQQTGAADKAREVVRAFHQSLCELRILDPACGTGNFLYVAMEMLKRLEGEVLEVLTDLGDTQYNLELDRHTIDPHQFLGLEINPRAVAIAELVLWIGYLQWHFRIRGQAMPAEPVLKNFANIVEQDAILKYDSWDVLRDDSGRPITRWDGVTYTLHPITGEEIPDNEAQVELRRYIHPRAASWPKADFIIGNPPFIAGKDMRQELDDGYAEACWKARPHIPGGANFVMHFWDKAAETVRAGKARRFGLITTNVITQPFSRRVIEHHMKGKKPIGLVLAIPDHPWMKSADHAAVRIAMTVGAVGIEVGVLREVNGEFDLNTDAPKVEFSERTGPIQADLTIGAATASANPLQANDRICSPGVKLHGAGFIVTPAEAARLGLGKTPDLNNYILEYRNGRDLTGRPRGVMVIDLFTLTESEVRDRFPAVYQWVADRVKPERDLNNRETYRVNWWVFGEPRRELRPALLGLQRYIATVETAKHRFFEFLHSDIRPDNRLVCFALEDAYHLGVLSSHIHVTWALKVGGLLEDRPIYTKSLCFDPFPFPDAADDKIKSRIRDLAEKLDRHRKSVLEQHKQLTMTGLYNVLDKVRAGETLTAAEKDVYDAGLVGVLRELHDDIDRAVTEAYGWPAGLNDEQILERIVALNSERAREERAGKVRWLRPEFQAAGVAEAARKTDQLEVELTVVDRTKKPSLPAALPDQVAAIRALLAQTEQGLSARDVASAFSQGRRAEGKVQDVLRTLAMLGQAAQTGDRFLLTAR